MGERATILIVDDEAELREVLEEYLTGQGYTALSAEDAVAARALCEKQAIDLAILDIHLPGEDGLSLARHLRERYKMAIVMLTSAGTVVDRIVGLEMGADDYVTKPFDPRELLARIKSVLRRATSSGDLGASRVRIGRCVLDLGAHRLTDEVGHGGADVPARVRPPQDLHRASRPGAVARADPEPEHAQRSGPLRSQRGSPHPATQEEDRARPGASAVHQDRAQRGVRVPAGWGRGVNADRGAIAVPDSLGMRRDPAPPLRIGTNVWTGSEPLYLARDLGYLDPRTVQLVEYPSASEVLRAFRNQAIDGAVISLDEVLVARRGRLAAEHRGGR